MKLEHIIYFVSIAHTESLTKTAERYYLSQPTMSKAIRNLEEELGFALFVRKKTGMYLTAQGERFLPFAEKIVEQYQLYQETINKNEGTDLSEIELAVSPQLLQSYYTEIQQVLSRITSRKQISIIEADSRDIRELVCEKPKVCALLACDSVVKRRLEEAGLMVESLYRTPLVLCTAKTARLASKTDITEHDLEDIDIISLNTDRVERNANWGKIVFQTSNLELLMNRLIEEKSVCVVPQKIGEKCLNRKELVFKSASFLGEVVFSLVYNEKAVAQHIYSKTVIDKLAAEFSSMFYDKGIDKIY